MKRIDLSNIQAEEGTPSPVDVLKLIATQSPQKAMAAPEMRSRLKFLDAVEKAAEAKEDSILVEDSVHAIISEAAQSFPWSRATRSLLATIDAITSAGDVDVAELARKKADAEPAIAEKKRA